MPALPVSLEDKYTLASGRVFLTGTQALVRLAMIQRERDLAAGLNTGGFISGYRGSPLAASAPERACIRRGDDPGAVSDRRAGNHRDGPARSCDVALLGLLRGLQGRLGDGRFVCLGRGRSVAPADPAAGRFRTAARRAQ